MNDTALRMRLMLLCVLAASALGVWLLPNTTQTHHTQYLQVHYLDVGQGDATFIETPTGVQVLIDGGPECSSTY